MIEKSILDDLNCMENDLFRFKVLINGLEFAFKELFNFAIVNYTCL